LSVTEGVDGKLSLNPSRTRKGRRIHFKLLEKVKRTKKNCQRKKENKQSGGKCEGEYGGGKKLHPTDKALQGLGRQGKNRDMGVRYFRGNGDTKGNAGVWKGSVRKGRSLIDWWSWLSISG